MDNTGLLGLGTVQEETERHNNDRHYKAKKLFIKYRLFLELTGLPRFVYWAICAKDYNWAICAKDYISAPITNAEDPIDVEAQTANSCPALNKENALGASSQFFALATSMFSVAGPFLIVSLLSLGHLQKNLIGTSASDLYNGDNWHKPSLSIPLNLLCGTYGFFFAARCSQIINGHFVADYFTQLYDRMFKRGFVSGLAMTTLLCTVGGASALIQYYMGVAVGENIWPPLGYLLGGINWVVYNMTRSIGVYDSAYAWATGALSRNLAIQNFVCADLKNENDRRKGESLLVDNQERYTDLESLRAYNDFAKGKENNYSSSARIRITLGVLLFTMYAFSMAGYTGFDNANNAALHQPIPESNEEEIGYAVAFLSAIFYAKSTIFQPLFDAKKERSDKFQKNKESYMLENNCTWKKLLEKGNTLDLSVALFSTLGVLLLTYKTIDSNSAYIDAVIDSESDFSQVAQLFATAFVSYFSVLQGCLYINLNSYQNRTLFPDGKSNSIAENTTRKEELNCKFIDNPDCIDASEFSPFKPLKDCFEPISNLFGRLSRKKNSEPEIPLDGQDIENGQYKKLEESGVQSRI